MNRKWPIFVLALAVAVPVALAAGQKSGKNPRVSLTGKLNPGLWQTTIHGTRHDGKAFTHKNSPDCITAADLEDFLNSGKDNPKVEKYSLRGNHLYVKAQRSSTGSMGSGAMTVTENMYFDDANHMHGTFKVRGAYEMKGTRHKIDTTTKISSRRISPRCPNDSGD